MRGQVFIFNNTKFFVMGGAESYDKVYRIEGINWWHEELPSYMEMNEGINNLKKHNDKVDYIISHDVSSNCKMVLEELEYLKTVTCNCLNKYLQEIYNTIEFKHNYAGHYHKDITLSSQKTTIVYNKIHRIV